MTRSFTIIVGILLLAATVAIVIVRKPDVKRDGSQNDLSLKPSRENVSRSVGERISYLRHIADKDPENFRVAFELAQLLQDSHDNSEAARFYAQALEFDGGNTGARVDYALCLYELGKPNEALQQCRMVLVVDPQNPQALFNAGAVHANNGLPDSAETYWGRLIAKHPHDELATKAKENLRQLKGKSTT